MSPDTGPDFSAMSLNERLVVAGLLEAWDMATAARDRGEVIRILKTVAVSRPHEVADDIL